MSAVWRRAVAFSVLIHLPYVISSSTSYQRGDTVPLYANKARYSFVRPSKTETWNSKSFGQVGPFANPSEQYEYYTLPFCAPKVFFSFCCIIREDFWSAKAGLNFSGWGTEKPAFGRGLGWRSDDENFIFSSVPGYLNYRISHNRFFPTAFHCSSIWGQKVVHIHAQAQWYWSIPEGNRWRVLFWIHLRYDILRSHLDLCALTTSAWADDLPIWGFIGEKEVQRRNGEERTNYYLFTHYIFSVTHNGQKVEWRVDSSVIIAESL